MLHLSFNAVVILSRYQQLQFQQSWSRTTYFALLLCRVHGPDDPIVSNPPLRGMGPTQIQEQLGIAAKQQTLFGLVVATSMSASGPANKEDRDVSLA